MADESMLTKIPICKMYQDIERSEAQITSGEVKDARAALREMREKYGI